MILSHKYLNYTDGSIAQKNVFSPDFLVQKLFGKERFPHGWGNSPETMWKLCLSTKFSHQKIRWNYSILRSDQLSKNFLLFSQESSIIDYWQCSESLAKTQSNFIEITLRQRYSPLNLLHIFRTTFLKNTYRPQLLKVANTLLVYGESSC